jgi:polysaccharide deacetylase family protein (PEP-CTERM system associated)
VSDLTIIPLRTRGPAPRVLTVDVEDWFHVCGDDYYSDPRRWSSLTPRIESSLGGLLDSLEGGGHRATFFVLGWIARRYAELVREIVGRGHELAVHGDLHRRADEMTLDEFRDDLRRARDAVADAGGARPAAYRAAEWSIREPTAPALAILAAEGFRCDASILPVPPLGLADSPIFPFRIERDGWSIVEVPPLTGRVLGRRLPLGGAWPFRLLPEAALSRAEVAARSAGRPAVFTLHPWELDPEHPPMDGASAITRLVHFAGLADLPARLDRWLARERCIALEDVLGRLEPAA